MLDQLIKWRRELHQIPEIGLKEFKTSNYIRKELEAMGYQWESILETGTYVYIDNNKKDTIAFRSDIDALVINECNDIDYKSKHDGMMHACGHDGHMSALLGLANKLKESTDDFPHNILLLFQPAEESPGAARLIVETGIFEKHHVKEIYGMHLMPFLAEGIIATKKGPLMAMCGELDVKVIGKSAHAGLSNNGIDSIVIASHAIQMYQDLLSRRISPFQSVVLNIGKINGGTVRNGVAGETEYHGTVRCFDENTFNEVTRGIGNIHNGLKNIYGCNIEWSCPPLYPPVLNDSILFNKFKKVVEDLIELSEPLMLAEDFSYYQKVIPGLFFFLGTKSNKYSSGLHTEKFNFDEKVLLKAVDIYYQLALQ